MDFLNDTAQNPPAGDTYLSQTARKGPALGKFVPSDIPGFVNPVVGGKPDKTSYIPEAALQGDGQPPVFTRDEAVAQGKGKKRSPAEVLYAQEGQA